MNAVRKIAPQLHGLEEVAPGVFWGQVFWMAGDVPTKQRFERSEVEAGKLGWDRVFVLDQDLSAKTVTLFDPYSFEGYSVTRVSFEFSSLKKSTRLYDADWHAKNFVDKWAQAQKNHWQRDFETAAVFMRALGLPPPTDLPIDSGEAKIRGGQNVAPGLLKPVKRRSRTGQILDFFWPKNNQSTIAAMAEFQMSRSNVLSQLYQLTKVHGIGYKLLGTVAVIIMPEGCENPWAPEEQTA